MIKKLLTIFALLAVLGGLGYFGYYLYMTTQDRNVREAETALMDIDGDTQELIQETPSDEDTLAINNEAAAASVTPATTGDIDALLAELQGLVSTDTSAGFKTSLADL